MIVRAYLAVPDLARARRVSAALCSVLASAGRCQVLTMEPDPKPTGLFRVYVRVTPNARPAPTSRLRGVADSLAAGRWKFDETDPEEAFATWDLRDGGQATIQDVTWLCVELHAGDGAA